MAHPFAAQRQSWLLTWVWREGGVSLCLFDSPGRVSASFLGVRMRAYLPRPILLRPPLP